MNLIQLNLLLIDVTKLSSYNRIDDNGIKVLAKSLQGLQNLISLNIDLRFEIINKKLKDFTLIKKFLNKLAKTMTQEQNIQKIF